MEANMSLADLLQALELQEELQENYTKADRERIRFFLLEKVDSWRVYLDERSDEVARHRAYAKEHADLARSIEDRMERSKAWLVKLMQEKRFERLSGNEWQVNLHKSKAVDIDGDIQPTEEVAELFPAFVSIKYSWQKSALKMALEAGRCPLTFMKLKENFSPQFKPSKGK